MCHAGLRGRQREDGTQNRADARGPCRAKRHAHEGRSQVPERLAGELQLPLAHQKSRSQDAEQIEAEQDHHDPSDASEPHLRLEQQHAQRRCRRTERDEDEGKSRDEPERVDERRPATHVELLEGQSGDEPDVAWNQRQDARREEAQQARRECDCEREARRGQGSVSRRNTPPTRPWSSGRRPRIRRWR